MKKGKRILCAVLAVTVLIGSAGTFLYCKKNKSKNDSSYQGLRCLVDPSKEPKDGIGEPGKDFKLLQTGNIDDWGDTPTPKFNPLGSYSLYSNVEYAGKTSDAVTLHLLDGYTEQTQQCAGEQWQMTISNPDYSLYWMRWYTKEAGGTWYPGTRDHSAFSIKENDNVTWWADVEQSGPDSIVTVIKVNTLPEGKPMTIHPKEQEGNEYIFYTDPLPGKLPSAALSLTGSQNAGVQLELSAQSQLGEYSYSVSAYKSDDQLNTKKTDRFVLDNLPVIGVPLCWKLTWGNSADIPDTITVELSAAGDIEPVKWGSEPGAIRIVGAPGDAEVILPSWIKSSHKQVSMSEMNSNQCLLGAADSNGDMVFTAPAGYYHVLIPSGISESDNFIRLVPVNAGEVTTVTIPTDAKAATGAVSRLFGDFDSNDGGIELLSHQQTGSTAKISFVLNDPMERDIDLKKDDLAISEDGVSAKITDIVREPAGSDVVLVLDSSGSMGENMGPCIAAAKRFVESLPENSTIQLVQFSQQVTLHSGSNKESILKALDTVRAGGGTSLYDAASQALDLLKDKKRGYAVIFSDGADSREPGVDGEGSSLSKEDILEKISSSSTAVLTIGFGSGHDPSTLIAMSSSSKGGGYFAAADKTALEAVFGAVSGKFGNQFTVNYERPTIVKDENSDVPVVAIMADRSGSMDIDPAEGTDGDVGWRIDKVKSLFHDFIGKLPEGTLIQFGSFSAKGEGGGEPPRIDQLTTNQKPRILSAIGSMEAAGGTPTREALSLAYSNLSSVPSDKRVLVFFTDAALYDPEEPELLNDILEKLKASGVRVLFAGLSDANTPELEEIFKSAAQKVNGDYIVTSDFDALNKKLEDVLSKLNTPSQKKGIDFSINVSYGTENNGVSLYSAASTFEDFAPQIGKGKTIAPQTIAISTGEPYVRYNLTAAQKLYGSDQPGVESNILLHMQLNKSGSNGFGKLTVNDIYLMDVFKGIQAPQGQMFAALDMTMEFQKANPESKEQGYCIPSIFQHFYLSVNNGRMMPASEATWLAEKPFASPGDPDVTVYKKEAKSGIMVFLIDTDGDATLTQLSIHLYDTTNGHIELPLAGALTKKMLEMSALPTSQPQKMSDTFSLTVTGKNDLTSLEGIELPQESSEFNPAEAKKNASFRVVEAQFDVKVQALLDIIPQERFFYQIETDQGLLMTPMSNIVNNLPLGFTGSTLLAPGSSSNVRLPFLLPSELLDKKGSIFGDLATGSVSFPVQNGAPLQTGGDGVRFSHQYFDLTVNSFAPAADGSRQAILDFTLTDKKDGFGTSGLESVLLLQQEDMLSGQGDTMTDAEKASIIAGRKGLGDFSSSEYGDSAVYVDTAATGELVFGAVEETGTWSVFDGQSRRGILVFELPEGGSSWCLTSTELPDMKVSLSSQAYSNASLLAKKPEIPEDSTFAQLLSEKVSAAVTAWQSTHSKERSDKVVGLSDDEVMGQQVPSPSLTLYGTEKLKKLKSAEDFNKLMASVGWIPSSIQSNCYRYAPEAVLTQGWGSQNDLAVLSKTALARLGYTPSFRTVTLTAAGQDVLRKATGMEVVPTTLPGIAYITSDGTEKLFVPVFFMDLSQLHGYAYLALDTVETVLTPAMGHLSIELYGKVTGEAAGIAGANGGLWEALGGALSGEEGDGSIYDSAIILDRDLSLPDMSLDAIDISYISKPKSGGGTYLLPVVDTRQGLIYDPNAWVDTSCYEFERITIHLGDGEQEYTHSDILSKGQRIEDICHTLAWGVPELLPEAADSVEKLVEDIVEAAPETGNYGISRWTGHATLLRLVNGLSDAGRSYSKALSVLAGRSDQSIALMMTMAAKDGKTSATVDLMNHKNQVHTTDENLCHAYNLLYGYFASDMEGAALPGGKGSSYTQVWNSLPEGTRIVPIEIDSKDAVSNAQDTLGLKENYPPLLLTRMEQAAEVSKATLYLVPNKPGTIDGEAHWAWLEIDLHSYDVVSVFEDGQRAGMGEYLIGCFPGNGNYGEVGAGALVGITTAVGSVAAYSLTSDDYKAVRAAAYQKCVEIGKYMEKLTGVTGAIDAGGKVKDGLFSGVDDMGEWVGIKWEKLFEAGEGIWVNKLTFTDGYNFAVKCYFGVE